MNEARGNPLNEMPGDILVDIVRRVTEEGGNPSDVMEIVATLIASACIAVALPGREEKLFDIVVVRARQRLAEARLAPIEPKGSA